MIPETLPFPEDPYLKIPLISYKGAMDWLDDYVKSPQEDTEFTVRLEYFNTSSSKCLVEIFRKLEGIYNDGKVVNIMWFYEEEDEDMMESGQDLSDPEDSGEVDRRKNRRLIFDQSSITNAQTPIYH